MPSDSRCAVTFSRDAFRATPLVRLTMFPGGSLHTRQIRRNASEEVTSSPTPYRNVTMFPGGSLHTRQIRRNASEEVTSSPTPYRNVTTFPRQQRPKLFPDLHKGAVDGCLGRNAQLMDDEKKHLSFQA